MAALLAVTGLFLYLRLGDSLDETLEEGLRSRAAEIAAGAGRGQLARPVPEGLAEGDERVAQVLDASGRVVDATPTTPDPLLDAAELRRAREGIVILDRESLPGLDDPWRLLATPAGSPQRPLVVVVGAPTDDREETLSTLAALMLVGGPIALALAALAGYGLAAAGLRPVESMRRRSEEITAAEPGRRLPVGPARDELARLGETLNEMLARLEAAFARERAFVADASHELRTPLAALRAELELGLRPGRSNEEQHAAIASAAEEVDRLAQLADDLLVIARLDRGRLPLRIERVDAGDLLEGVARRFTQRAREAGRAFAIEPADGVAAQADRLRLEQALGNVVDNALRHGSGCVTLAARRREDRVELSVSDEGPGFPAAFLPHAFERFARADEGRGRGGAGLGLSIVRAIAAAHGGAARVENQADAGARVSIDLPAQDTTNVPPYPYGGQRGTFAGQPRSSPGGTTPSSTSA